MRSYKYDETPRPRSPPLKLLHASIIQNLAVSQYDVSDHLFHTLLHHPVDVLQGPQDVFLSDSEP